MRLRMFAILVVVALITSTSAMVGASCLQQKAERETDPISGEWDVSFEIAGTTTPAIFKLKLDGNKVTGTAESHHTGPGTLSNGSWVNEKLRFTLNFTAHESIAVTGTLKDGYLVGEFATEGMQGKWKAKKKGASVEKSTAGPSADLISSKWESVIRGAGHGDSSHIQGQAR